MNEAAGSRVVEFAIAGMTCAACSARLEKVLNRQQGMQANVNLAAERARVRLEGAADEAAVIAAVARAGFTASLVDKDTRAREKARRAADCRREQALSTVYDPDLKKDLVSLNMVKDIQLSDKKVSFTVVLTTPA